MLIFNATKIGLLDRSVNLTSGVFYAHLVTTAPTNPALTTVSQLTLAAGGNYAPYIFPSLPSFSVIGSSGIASFGNLGWNSLNTNNAGNIQGFVVCRRIGASPANTDPLLMYNDLPNAFPPSGATLIINMPATGTLRLLFTEGFVFNQTYLGLLNRNIDLTAGVFYAHLVITAPTNTALTTVSQLTLATGENYSPVQLTGLGFATNGNNALWIANDPSWENLLIDSGTVKGVVICKRTGATFATTDPVLAYKPLNTTQFPSGYMPNGAQFTAEIGANKGLLRAA